MIGPRTSGGGARHLAWVIAGGPTGMMLACELALAGVRPVVLER